jgi:hypothetical protein
MKKRQKSRTTNGYRSINQWILLDILLDLSIMIDIDLLTTIINHHLVGGFNPPKNYEFVSWDYYSQYIWKTIFQITNQSLTSLYSPSSLVDTQQKKHNSRETYTIPATAPSRSQAEAVCIREQNGNLQTRPCLS